MKEMPKEVEGAAIFEFVDDELGLTQRFAFSLRYYVGASSVKLKKVKKAKRKHKGLTQKEI